MATTKAPSARPSAPPVKYPYSDGVAMAETPRHVFAIVNAIATLCNHFEDSPDVQVGSNTNLFYEEGNPDKKLVPDLYVVRGLWKLPKRSYKVWAVGRPPCFVLEVASPSSEKRDLGEKQVLYAAMGVKEYWRFNPVGALEGASQPGDCLDGGTLKGLAYEALARCADGSIRSDVLGLEVRVDERPGMGHLLRFRDPLTHEDLRTFAEEKEARRKSEQALSEERQARRKSERALSEERQARRESERARLEGASENDRLRARIAKLEAGRTPGISDTGA